MGSNNRVNKKVRQMTNDKDLYIKNNIPHSEDKKRLYINSVLNKIFFLFHNCPSKTKNPRSEATVH